MSLVEATINVTMGYVLAVVTQIAAFPWFGIEATVHEHLAIGISLAGVSFSRAYLL